MIQTVAARSIKRKRLVTYTLQHEVDGWWVLTCDESSAPWKDELVTEDGKLVLSQDRFIFARDDHKKALSRAGAIMRAESRVNPDLAFKLKLRRIRDGQYAREYSYGADRRDRKG